MAVAQRLGAGDGVLRPGLKLGLEAVQLALQRGQVDAGGHGCRLRGRATDGELRPAVVGLGLQGVWTLVWEQLVRAAERWAARSARSFDSAGSQHSMSVFGTAALPRPAARPQQSSIVGGPCLSSCKRTEARQNGQLNARPASPGTRRPWKL